MVASVVPVLASVSLRASFSPCASVLPGLGCTIEGRRQLLIEDQVIHCNAYFPCLLTLESCTKSMTITNQTIIPCQSFKQTLTRRKIHFRFKNQDEFRTGESSHCYLASNGPGSPDPIDGFLMKHEWPTRYSLGLQIINIIQKVVFDISGSCRVW